MRNGKGFAFKLNTFRTIYLISLCYKSFLNFINPPKYSLIYKAKRVNTGSVLHYIK